MDISAELAADLAALTEALGDPAIDLEAELRAFSADLARAVASYTGMQVTISLDGRDIWFAVAAGVDTASAETSLTIPLSAVSEIGDGNSLVIYAATAGAFVDLAADLSYVLDIDPALLVLDQHLVKNSATTPPGAGIAGLSEYSLVHQAIGFLIARGHTPDSARDELHRRASLDGGDVVAAAGAVLHPDTPHRGADDATDETNTNSPPSA